MWHCIFKADSQWSNFTHCPAPLLSGPLTLIGSQGLGTGVRERVEYLLPRVPTAEAEDTC